MSNDDKPLHEMTDDELHAAYKPVARGSNPELRAAIEAERERRKPLAQLEAERTRAGDEHQQEEDAKRLAAETERARLENLTSAQEKASRAVKLIESYDRHNQNAVVDFHASKGLMLESLAHMHAAGIDVMQSDLFKWHLELSVSNDVHRLKLPIRGVGFDAGVPTVSQLIEQTRAKVVEKLNRSEFPSEAA
jgi:hypothetical protein